MTLTPSSPPKSDHAVEHDRRPLIAHLTELRRRLVVSLLAYGLAVAACYWFAPQIYAFLVQPLADAMPGTENRHLIYTGLTEAFFTYLRLAMFAGLFVAFPIIASQAYGFLAPGLYSRERRAFLPYLIAAPALFISGASLCYWGIFPVAWKFFLSFQSTGAAGGLPIQLEARVSEYLSLVTHLVLAFGIAFQLPVVLALLVQIGWLKTSTLTHSRRYAILIVTVAAAIVTPPDVFSMTALAVPMYLLYEGSIVVCRMIEKRKANA